MLQAKATICSPSIIFTAKLRKTGQAGAMQMRPIDADYFDLMKNVFDHSAFMGFALVATIRPEIGRTS
ncbi:hypothetical protein LLG90_18125 [Aromatoleum toluclasticum]|uniref:hypothetical protein n=1 Tax=Aromatoleum toluclasticum TaxID=92003 RepID=UPI001D1975E0|nr:hypothetical protein [Aromatoleum toluclasticum]MCC4117275.1 hypothetical protein [Aromatoleum toluclasticum]